jgi:hypothetical protein
MRASIFSRAAARMLFACMVLGAFAACSACSPRVPEHRFEFLVRVSSGPDRPVRGASVLHGTQPVGVSGDDGLIQLRSSGSEGELLAFRVACPDGYKSPSEPLSIVLRRLGKGARAPEYWARCEPTSRTLVVVVRAEKAAGLPVRHLGSEVGRTDADGIAHVLLRAPPDESVELVLDTSGHPRLKPQQPTARFDVGAQDALHLFEQEFQSDPPPRPRGPRRIARPIRIN